MGFILSKINLMILVIAIFAIVSYFMLGLGGLLVNKVARDLALNNSRDVYGMIFSKTSCDSKVFNLPDSLSTSVSSGASGMYYKFIIKKIPALGGGMNSISFIITPAREPTKVLAADNFKADAGIFFCDFEGGECSEDAEQIELEPQSAPVPKDAFLVVKQVRSGQKSVYFIACSTEGTHCKANYTNAAQEFVQSDFFDCSPDLNRA